MLRKAVVMVGVVVGVLGFCCMSYGADLDKGLGFYAPFDGSMNAKISGGIESPQKAIQVKYEEGINGKGAVINGMDKLVYKAEEGYFSFERGTISFWVKANYDNAGFVETVKKHESTQGGYFSQMFIKAAATNANWKKLPLTLRLVQTGGKRFQANACTYPSIQHYKSASLGLEKGKWVNLLYTWDVDEENIEFYVDGKKVKSKISQKSGISMSWEMPDEKIDYSMCEITISGASIYAVRGGKTIYARKRKKLQEMLADILPDDFTYTIDELRIYTRVLNDDEVKELVMSRGGTII